MEKIIAIAANIGTFISSIFVFFTLKEMKAQRKAQVKPVMILESNAFTIINNSYCKIVNDLLDETLNSFDIFISNEGLSLAKNVSILFKYNIKDFRKTIIHEKISIQKTKNILKISTPIISQDIDMASENCKIISFIKNEIDTSDNIVSVPDGYKTLLSVFEYYCSLIGDDFKPIMPKLFCTVSYEDILNNRYKEKYFIQVYYNGLIGYGNIFIQDII